MNRRDRNVCNGCRVSFERVPHAPMLFDATWLKLAQKRELLCPDCLFARAARCGIRITLADLRPCPFNRFGEPLSWFELFAGGERPEVIEAWLKWLHGQEAAR